MLMCGVFPLYPLTPLLPQLRCALIIMVAEVAYCCWILEQPMGSADTLPYHPRMDGLFNQVIYEPSLNSFLMGISENGTVIQTTG